MSRKSKKQQTQLPIDTGGLNLTLPPPPAEEPAIDVTAAPSNAHKAMEELETLPPPPDRFAWGEEVTTNPNGTPDNAVMLNEALHMSSLWLAVRMTSNPEILVIANGTRFWTVDAKKLEPMLAEGVGEVNGLNLARVWRPVAGNERGWYVG